MTWPGAVFGSVLVATIGWVLVNTCRAVGSVDPMAALERMTKKLGPVPTWSYQTSSEPAEQPKKARRRKP